MRLPSMLVAAGMTLLLSTSIGFAAGQSGANSTSDCQAGTTNTTKTMDCALDQQKEKAPGSSNAQTQGTPKSPSGNGNSSSSGGS